MSFDISSPGAIAGKTRVPGDCRLTLSILAFAMLVHDDITINNIAPSPEVEKFIRFMERNGAEIDHSGSTAKLRGKG